MCLGEGGGVACFGSKRTLETRGNQTKRRGAAEAGLRPRTAAEGNHGTDAVFARCPPEREEERKVWSAR
jgi:hypothetical protein